MSINIYFNVLAKDLENAVEISRFAPERTLVGVMVKNFATDDEAVTRVEEFKANGVRASVGLGGGDPAMWKRVADVSVRTCPFHINQVFPAAGYTMGRLQEIHKSEFIVNSLIEPAGEPGIVYMATGAISSRKKEPVSAELAAKLMADIGLPSVKFYPIGGLKCLDELKAMVRAAVNEGITIFEPTGGINMENVHEIVRACIDSGATTIIPHLYTSLVDPETGRTNPECLERLAKMSW
ncbi:MAG: KDGP aldolase [Hungatella sp.]|jgi:2-dehydro-3-deoxy-phosphogluconate aldolase|nr:KDGP aldolase [Hungatella sp.]